MTEPLAPRLRHVQCLDSRGLHRMAYWEWGDPANRRVLVCVHGLSRQGRDFDTLAADLCQHYRVVCPDVVGRGQSDWLADPMGYAIPAYVADMVTLLARLDAETVDWVGTSMGGLIGLGVAALPRSPLRRLVLNDVGPSIEPASLARIGTYLGLPVHWSTVDEAADALWAIIAINLSSAFHSTRAALPGMKARNWGRVSKHRPFSASRLTWGRVGDGPAWKPQPMHCGACPPGLARTRRNSGWP